MDAKIQEITEKIYREGVEKGNEQANAIITEAQSKKNAIILNAEKESETILSNAQKQADELKKHTVAELKLFTNQAVEALKSEICNLLTDKIITQNITAATIDAVFMQKMILELAKQWAEKENITIGTADAKNLTSYFQDNAKELLNKGVKIEQVNGISSSFTISPSNGSYKINFGEEELIAYFKEFLRPQLVSLLF